MESKLAKARRASGMTLEAAAAIMGVSVPTYMDRESNPAKLTTKQFIALASEMDADSRVIMAGLPADVESAAGGWKPMQELTLGELYAARKNADARQREFDDELVKLFA